MSVTLALVLLAESTSAAPPAIATSTALSALPSRQSLGSAGPVNRIAFDIAHFSLADAGSTVECSYGSLLRYRCKVNAENAVVTGPLRRFVVEVPDLDRGKRITIRFANRAGADERTVELSNPSQVLHEIESIALPGGGETITGPSGTPALVSTLLTFKSTTAPALTVQMPFDPNRCDQLYAQWAGASATDPVFSSAFGALNGAVAIVKPVAQGSPVRDDNLPQWLITYPASAIRLQFIAHYEVVYRVGLCADRVLR